MREKKKLNKKKLAVVIIIIVIIVSIGIFARYVLTQNADFYTQTLEFYFTSDKLDVNQPLYRIENWSGVDDYTIVVNLNSNKNNILTADYEIDYEIEYTCSDNVLCELSKTSGTIPETTESDTVSLLVSPNTQFSIGDVVEIVITANASSPYEKEISAKFQMVVGQEKITYEITDEVEQPYFNLNITNTISYYTVSQAFGSYAVGDKITRDNYMELSDTDKEKCFSGIITLQFDPNYVLLDMTNENYINATNVTRTSINNYQYINGITFKVDAITGTRVRFYKADLEQNYTYPNPTNTSIITLTSLT